MGNKAGSHKLIHIARIRAQFHIGHIARNFMHFLLSVPGHGNAVRSGQRRIPDIMELFKINVREHADRHRVLHIDSASDAARHIDVLYHGHIKVQRTQHRADRRENRSLGTNKIVDINFINRHVFMPCGLFLERQHIAADPVLVPADSLSVADKFSLGADDIAAVQLRNHIDDTGAAQSHRFLSLFTHDLEIRLHRLRVDGTCLDRSIRSPHTAADIAAFKRGSRRTRAAHHKVGVSEYNLSVGSQVNKQIEFRLVPDHAHKRARCDISSHITADIRSDDHRCIRMYMKAQIIGIDAVRLKESRNIRFHTERIGVHSCKEMVHGCVGSHAHVIDAASMDTGGMAHIVKHGIDRFFDDRFLKLLLAALFPGFNNTVDDICPETDLPVSGRRFCKNLSVSHIQDHTGYRRRSDIDCRRAKLLFP